MNLRIAGKNDFDRVVEFYKNVIENTENMPEYGRWIYGLHPTDDMIRSYIESSCMYLMENDGRITAAVAVTFSQGEDYHSVKWNTNLDDTDVAVIHLLCVSPREQKQGIAKRVMQEIISIIRAKHKKAIRLDALFCNTPAHRLYKSLGFKKCDVKNWYAKNTGWIDFYLFELVFGENVDCRREVD
jgi:ribosomal protein S18 acetylase RimI-like enzyme